MGLGDSEDETEQSFVPTGANAEAVNQESRSEDSEQDQQSEESESSDGDEDDDDEMDDDQQDDTKRKKPISKRNDPEAFSTSMSKILSTKLSPISPGTIQCYHEAAKHTRKAPP